MIAETIPPGVVHAVHPDGRKQVIPMTTMTEAAGARLTDAELQADIAWARRTVGGFPEMRMFDVRRGLSVAEELAELRSQQDALVAALRVAINLDYPKAATAAYDVAVGFIAAHDARKERPGE